MGRPDPRLGGIEDMKTVMDYWCEFRKQQGGTIQEALHEFKHVLSDSECDKFCRILMNNLSNIQDKHHAQDLMKARLDRNGIVIHRLR